MKKQWILTGTLAMALVIVATTVSLNGCAGDKTRESISTQTSNTTISHLIPTYVDEPLPEWISPEGFLHELFVLRFATPGNSVVQATNTVYYDVPQYDGQPLPEGFSPVDNTQEPNTNGSETE